MGNPWMDHVQSTRKANPSKSFKEVLVLAGKTYKKGTKTAAPAKKSRKTKKSSSKKSRKSSSSKKSRRSKK